MAEPNTKNMEATSSKNIIDVTVNIKDLRPGDKNKILEAKVYRTWIARDPPDTTQKGYRAILLDRQGNAIQANVEATEMRHFTNILIPGKAYRISHFTCIPTDNWQQTLEKKTSLSFTRFTKFDAILPEGFPNHYFNFVSYNRLPHRVVDPKDKARKEYPVLTDYIGCYISSGNIEKIGNPNRDQMVIRRVEIQNLNRNSIELTLWDDLAETFKKDEIDRLEKPIIIAVSSCRVSTYRNRLQLSSTPATYYYINPKIPELEEYREEYREAFNLNPPLEVTRQPYENKEQQKMRNRFPLAVLLQQNPKTYAGVRFTCEGSITSLNATRDWYYPRCTNCALKVENNYGTFECRIHGSLNYPFYRYNFRGYLTDNTATATMTFFTPKAEKIVGIDCNSLVTSLNIPDPRDIPERILSIVGKPHIFQFHYNTTTKQGPPEFVFDDIMDKPEIPKQIQDKPSGSETPQEPYQAIEAHLPQQQVSVTAECAPTLPPAAQTETTPLSPTYEEQIQGQTPPSAEETMTETSSKIPPTETNKSAPTKRQLFHDRPQDTKKTKKE